MVTLRATEAALVTVSVTFIVTPAINLSPSTLSYATMQGAATPANQNISLTNTDGTLN